MKAPQEGPRRLLSAVKSMGIGISGFLAIVINPLGAQLGDEQTFRSMNTIMSSVSIWRWQPGNLLGFN